MNNKIFFRVSVDGDLPGILNLLRDDELGSKREQALDETNDIPEFYSQAHKDILSDKNNEIIVGELNGELVACLQMTYIPNLTLKASKRAMIEAVRVSSKHRGQKLGAQMFEFCISRAKQKGCVLAQLTCNKVRKKAHNFYESMGFKASHEGFKVYFK